MSNYLVGSDAVDLARITGLSLNRSGYRIGDAPDIGWQVADQLVSEGVDPNELFFDLDRLLPADASHVILSLVGLMKALLPENTNAE